MTSADAFDTAAQPAADMTPSSTDTGGLTGLTALDTPCFVFDEKELRQNFSGFSRALQDAWSPLAKVAYSVKTNPFGWILDVAREEGCLAEVVSADEFAHTLDHGFTPDQVIFNGPIKPRAWLEYALAQGSVVNLDSVTDLSWTCAWAQAHPEAHPRVGVRANIELDRFIPGETTTGSAGGRFGFCYENGQLGEAIQQLRNAGVDVAGLHMHVTTQSRSLRAYQVLARHVLTIAQDYQLDLRFIDMGGGYYGGGWRNAGAYEAYAASMATILKQVADPARCALYVEPGGAVVCTPARYVGTVLDSKTTTVDTFVTCSLSRINIDHEMKKTSYPLHVLDVQGRPKLPGQEHPSAPLMDRQVLCGFTCMESDRLCVLEHYPRLELGDTLVIDFAGAYSMCFTPGFFIEHAPAVYKRDSQGICTLLRPSARPAAPAADVPAAAVVPGSAGAPDTPATPGATKTRPRL